jgi:transcription antitermination factor NusG
MRLDWFAVRLKSNREQVTEKSLATRGYDVFLPRYRPQESSKDKLLFPGYLFCRMDITQRVHVLMLPGVVNILGFGSVPVPVDETELESIRLAVNAGFTLELERNFQPGRKVRIERGPLAGAEGVVAGVQRQRLILSVTLLQRSVSIMVEPGWVTREEAVPLVRQAGGGMGWNS